MFFNLSLAVCSKPQELPWWNLKWGPILGEQRETKERIKPPQMDGRVSISKGTDTLGLSRVATAA